MKGFRVDVQSEMTNSGRYRGWLTIKDVGGGGSGKGEWRTRKTYASRAAAIKTVNNLAGLQHMSGNAELLEEFRAMLQEGKE